MLRTHTCGALRLNNTDQTVSLCGWVQEIRDKGHLLWIDLRDRYGITQIILDKNSTPEHLFEQARTLGREDVLQVQGTVMERSAKNNHRLTGEIEVIPTTIQVLNKSKTPPFLVAEETNGSEALRMQYRYIDLRRPSLLQNLLLRHRVTKTIHTYLDQQNFIEIETPILVKSTPEGARDFIVPARMHPGQYYALPQSPQLFKQLSMVAGVDRYYQIGKCFRDEDLRADRQPEFTQIDCEMSFATQNDVLDMCEGLIRHLFQTIKNITLDTFPRMSYAEAISIYGSDKPDLRWDMPFIDITEKTRGAAFSPFEKAPLVLAICIKDGASYSRKQLDTFRKFVTDHHPQVSAFSYVKYIETERYQSPLSKFYKDQYFQKWVKITQATPNDLLMILSGPIDATRLALAAIRKEVIQMACIQPKCDYAPLWVTDFPLLEWAPSRQAYSAVHHPFTAPLPSDIPLIDEKPEEVRSQAYDLVINGVELGSGSIRIHQRALQEKIFGMLGMQRADLEQQFGFLLRAFEYGAPPHGGIALGLERLCVLLGGGHSIRDYIAFPKNNQGKDVMIEAPAPLQLTLS